MLLCLAAPISAEEIPFNNGWDFSTDSLRHHKSVTLPHDFSMENVAKKNDSTHIGPFSMLSPNGRSVGHVLGGTGWYRKVFDVPVENRGKRYSLLFDGAYMETTVYVNQKNVYDHKNGYTPFYVDITDALNPVGQSNEIVIKVTNYGSNSRWFSGSGLYRDVTLVVNNPLHIGQWGAFITTPVVDDQKATVDMEISVLNEATASSNASLIAHIIDPKGNKVASLTKDIEAVANVKNVIKLQTSIDNPDLWSVDSPSLYTALIELKSADGKTTDSYQQKFGIRTISCNAETGLVLNGEPIVLKGGCIHHDNGLLGARSYKASEYRKVRLLKESGYNAVRCAHNPHSRYFLDACDELGLLVMDEFTDMWEQPKNRDDYAQFFVENWEQDLESMMLRDRNHPSIILWSIGNEIPNWSIADASRIGKQLSDKVRSVDPTRLVTQGITGAYIHLEWDNSQYTFQHLDVAGYNYLRDKYEGDHEKFPNRVIVCTESYPNQSYKYWKDAVDKPYVIGDFVWTALEHLGESGCGSARYVPVDQKEQQGMIFQTSMGPKEGMNPAMMWMGGGGDAVLANDNNATDSKQKKDKKSEPKKEQKPAELPFWMRPQPLPTTYVNWCGDIDLIGDLKPQGRYRRVMWDISPIEIAVHEPIPAGKKETMNLWGWPNEQSMWYWPGQEGKSLQVRVFSKATQVRLELNGKVVGIQKTDEELTAVFENVVYQPGKLVAISLDENGKELWSKVLRTPGQPTAVRVTRELNNIDNEIAYLKIEVVDADGQLVPATFPLSIQVNGAEMLASGNAGKDDMASFGSLTPKTYLGAAMLIVKPTAESVDVRVASDGLVSGEAHFSKEGKDMGCKEIGIGLCSVLGIDTDFEGSLAQIAKTGASYVELNNFMGGSMLGLSPEQTKTLADKYDLRIISDVTMASVIKDSKEYLERWNEILRQDAILGVKYVSMTANLYWGNKKNVLKCCKVLNKIGAMAKQHGIQFLYHLHNIEFNPIVGNKNQNEQIVDVLMANTDPELVKFQGDVFWIQIGGRDAAQFIEKHANRIPMLHVKDFYFMGDGDYLDYKSIFKVFYASGNHDWVLEMEDPMTREQMYQKAKNHNEMSQAKEEPQMFRPQPSSTTDNGSKKKVVSDRNIARIKSLRDIGTNMNIIRSWSFL